jgi:protein-S-isoprenylcysteine O-methyltransferase Ste14
MLSLILFLPAGRLDWVKGYLFLVVFFICTLIAVFYLRRVNPEIFAARRKIHKGTKYWDKIMLSLLMPTFMAIPLVAALDDERYGWSEVSPIFIVFGYLLFVMGFVLITWAMGVNRFFEPGVRIQTDRGHKVIDVGPYTLVRHPGYVAACLLFFGIALSLGSYWALVPASIATLLILLRTSKEDKTLQQELQGYAKYSQKVRFRLIPGIW